MDKSEAVATHSPSERDRPEEEEHNITTDEEQSSRSESESVTADTFQQDLNAAFQTIWQAANRTTMNDLAENRAANANNERLWNPTDLFHLTTGQRDYESILAPLREFLKNYDITTPTEIDDVYSVAEAHGLALQNNIHPQQYQNLHSIFHGCVVQWLAALLKLPATFSGVIASSAQAARNAVVLAAAKNRKLKRTDSPTIYSRYKTSWLSSIPSLLLADEDCVKVGTDMPDMIENDIKDGKVPLLLVGTVGNAFGRVEDCSELAELAAKHKLWLHVEGESLPLLAAKDSPKFLRRVDAADSILVDVSQLLGLRNISLPVLFFQREAPKSQDGQTSAQRSAIEEVLEAHNVPSPQLQLGSWFLLHYLGRNRIAHTVSRARAILDIFERRLSSFPHIKLLHMPSEDVLQFAFRFAPNLNLALEKALESSAPKDKNTESAGSSDEKTSSGQTGIIIPPLEEDADVQLKSSHLNDILPYLNQVNRQIISDIMHSSGIALEFDILTVNEDEYIRFRPLRSAIYDDVNKFCDHLIIESQLVATCLACRPFFQRAISKHPGLTVVRPHPPNLIGLGACRYNPLDPIFRSSRSAKEGRRISALVDELNNAIVERLNSEKHHIFCTLKTEDGLACIGVHVDIAPITRERCYRLAQLIANTAVIVEAETKFNDKVGDVIRLGIKEAKEALQKEKAAQQAGFVRKLPIVGTVMNWWSPVKKETKGKRFDLLTAQLEEDDTIQLVKKSSPAQKPKHASNIAQQDNTGVYSSDTLENSN